MTNEINEKAIQAKVEEIVDELKDIRRTIKYYQNVTLEYIGYVAKAENFIQKYADNKDDVSYYSRYAAEYASGVDKAAELIWKEGVRYYELQNQLAELTA